MNDYSEEQLSIKSNLEFDPLLGNRCDYITRQSALFSQVEALVLGDFVDW